MMILMLISCILMIFTKSPIIFIILLILITLMMAMLTFNLTYSIWLPMMIFLSFVGGLLILFMYMASISSNKKSFITPKSKLIKLILPLILLPLSFPLFGNITPPITMNSPITIFSMIFNMPFMIFSISYLFLFLLSLNLILKKKEGPLRSY